MSLLFLLKGVRLCFVVVVFFVCFFWVFRGPGAVKQEKTSRNTETNSKMNFIFGLVDLVVILYFWQKNNGAGVCWGAPPPRPPARGAPPPWTPR